MNPKRGVRDGAVDLRVDRDAPDRANRYASEQERRRCLDSDEEHLRHGW
jgi:hypothetical protein